MRMRASGWLAAMGIVALAGCGSGGELKEATERRRLQQAGADSAADPAAARDEGRLPAFSGDSVPAAPAAPDTQPRAPTGQWTTGVLDFRRPQVVGTVRGVRVARNDGFDRIVIDFGPGAPLPGWHVEYLDSPATECGTGDVVDLAGEGRLLVRLRTAQAHDDDGRATAAVREGELDMLPVLRELAFTCDFEGDVELVFGVAARNPYRVLELENPSRLVVDVQH